MADWINPNPIDTNPGGDTKYTGFVKAQANFDDIYSKLNVVKKLQSGDTAPSSPATGELWFDTVNNVLRRYDGTKWAKVNPNIGFKNRIINGDFSVWQRGTSVTGVTATGYYTADRYVVGLNTGAMDISKSSMNNKNSYKAVVNTVPDITTTGNTYQPLNYSFEGQHLYDLAIQGKDITISFWFKSNATGAFSVALKNLTYPATNIQSYVTEFNYSTADTPQKIEITIPLNAVWNPTPINNNALGFQLQLFALSASDKVASSLNTWLDGNYNMSPNAVNWASTAGNYIEIAELQLEEGSVATDFEYIPYDVQLLRCMRYYIYFPEYTYIYASPTSAGWLGIHAQFPVEMRTIPTIVYGAGGVDGQIRISDTPTYTTNVSVGVRKYGVIITSAGDGGALVGFYLKADAEL